ncbi:hypothetical protein G9C85_11025 [Halorubellus sp. JP-L1]|uniref:hypothetical protein n=1 Tax=Halorubellus sp. JP-L1 TaxID=2715753 RepID=UPI00140E19C3|nr:hypothetical protein [Halorubellus sp. JP-L1]NHN42155.1 hypothetical protein [Halorubellus sp. JP-L1]
MGAGNTAGGRRGVLRRAVLSGCVAGIATTTGCASFDVLGERTYDTVRVDVQADGVVWSGVVSFQSADGTRVSITVDRALGSRSYGLPGDIDADDYDVIQEPLAVVAVPEGGVSAGSPLAVVVYCEGERCGRATSTTADDPARVDVS